jgi:very-short-patch-repair endonuclease
VARDKRLIEFAKQNRAYQTEPEIRMWLVLRGKRFAETKFRRQKVIGPYIVDFACRRPMLVIELDGDSHGHQPDYDQKRTEYLEKLGYRVVRFTNREVMENMEGVLESLVLLIETPPLPTLSPKGERAIGGALTDLGERVSETGSQK